jgi:hypothetical protein
MTLRARLPHVWMYMISKDLLVEFDLLNELLDLLHADLAGHFVLVGPF